MLTNTEWFYTTAKKYQDNRKQIMDDYEKKMQRIESAKGSQFYVDEKTKIEKECKEKLDALRADCGDKMFTALGGMLKSAQKKPIHTPSEEQMRILSALQMREGLSKGEIIAIANSLSDCPLALSILQEKVSKLDYMGFSVYDYSTIKEIPVVEIEKTINDCKKRINDFLQYDTTFASRAAQNHSKELYGTESTLSLRKRDLFETKEQCFADLLGVNDLEAFSNTVD